MEAIMQSWKEKAKKLSRIFSFRSLSFDRSQTRSYFKKGKSSSSVDSSIRSSPISNAFTSHNGISENKSTNSTLPNNESGSSTKCDNRDIFSASEDSIMSTENQLNVKMRYLTEESSFISVDLFEFLLSSLPNIVKGCQWALLYSTVKHGISLRTLIRRSSDLSGPCLLGTNQTFVFTTVYGGPRLFRPTGANRYFYMCLNELLALGGGNFALCLDEDLLSGTSGPSETFGNQCLAHSSEFEVKNVESPNASNEMLSWLRNPSQSTAETSQLWGFTHSSRYLT